MIVVRLSDPNTYTIAIFTHVRARRKPKLTGPHGGCVRVRLAAQVDRKALGVDRKALGILMQGVRCCRPAHGVSQMHVVSPFLSRTCSPIGGWVAP